MALGCAIVFALQEANLPSLVPQPFSVLVRTATFYWPLLAETTRSRTIRAVSMYRVRILSRINILHYLSFEIDHACRCHHASAVASNVWALQQIERRAYGERGGQSFEQIKLKHAHLQNYTPLFEQNCEMTAIQVVA